MLAAVFAVGMPQLASADVAAPVIVPESAAAELVLDGRTVGTIAVADMLPQA